MHAQQSKDNVSGHHPPYRRRVTSVIILATVAINPMLFLLPTSLSRITTVIACLLFVLSLRCCTLTAVHVTLLTVLMAVFSSLWSWPVNLYFPVIMYFVVVGVFPSLRHTMSWLRVGKLDWLVWQLVLLTIFLSSAALLLWFSIWRPELGTKIMFIPDWSPVLLVAAGLGFAFINAAMEEAIYRGVLMHGIDVVLGPGHLSVLLQAIAFGFIHLIGVPGEWLGVGMATIYGLMLGIIRRTAKGLLAPFIAHVLADVVIFSMLTVWAR